MLHLKGAASAELPGAVVSCCQEALIVQVQQASCRQEMLPVHLEAL